MVKELGDHMTVLNPIPCYSEVCYKGTVLYIYISRDMRFPTMWHFDIIDENKPVQPILSLETPNAVWSVA